MWMSRAIDLKFRLALRIVALAALCFIAAFAYTLIESHRSTRARADWMAQIVAKDLALQQTQHHWVKFADYRFPDLQTIATPLMTPGVCIAYRSMTGKTLQRLCSGTQADETGAPEYFAWLYSYLFKPDAEATREVISDNTPRGEAVVSFDPKSVIARAWQDSSRLLTVMAITLAALCILVYAALGRALRSTRIIVSGLEKLAANDLSARLPVFDLAELSAIRIVFNTLAERLQAALAERNELTRRLIAVQDEERLHLARELHDEFGQCLAAISAVAASAGQTARQDCPALLPECQSIARTAALMMGTLRGTLIRLRPPDIDELGLTASLESLVAGWNSRSRGRTRFEINIDGSFDSLPPPFGVNLYRIAQEAITNAAKHAEATRVGLHLKIHSAGSAAIDGDEIELIVDDNGKANECDLATKSGMGLLGMRERVLSLGGRLSFETLRPTGLVLHAVIPTPHLESSTT